LALNDALPISSRDRFAMKEMNDSGDHSGTSRNWHTDEVFAPGAPGVRRRWIFLDVEARQPACSGDQKNECRHRAEMNEFISQFGIPKLRQRMESPYPCQD